MSLHNRCIKSSQTGVGLVEIMVALVIGLVVTLVVTQALSMFEGQKRTTSGTSDAQTNGSLALYAMAREAQMAGFGLPLFGEENSPMKCTSFSPAVDALTGVATNISPVSIIAGSSNSVSDRVILRFGDSQFAGVPVKVGSLAGLVVTVPATMGCQVGNDVMVVNGTACTLTKVVAISAPPTMQITLASNDNVAADADLSCLGVWRQVEFRVNGSQLERREMAGGADVVVPIGSEIVALKAQYGISAAGLSGDLVQANHIVQWVNATGTWAAPTTTDRNRIKAIRVAVVARNSLLEKDDVTEPCTSTTGPSPKGLCAWDATSANPDVGSPAPAIDLSGDVNWRRYRYQVCEAIIPLRNVIWSKNTIKE